MPRPYQFAHYASALVGLFLIALPIFGFAQFSRTPLLLSASLSRDVAKIGDQVFVTAILENKGTAPILLRGMRDLSAGGGFSLTVTNPNGQVTVIPPTPGMSLLDAQTGSRYYVLPINAGIRIRFPLQAGAPFTQPGKYQIRLSYASPRPAPGNPSVFPGQLEGQSAIPVVVTLNLGNGASE